MKIQAPYKTGVGGGIRWHRVTHEWLETEYLIPPKGKGKALAQIASEIGTTHATVQRWVRTFGIEQTHHERHSWRMKGIHNVSYIDGRGRKFHRNELLRSGRPRQCEWCSATDKLHVHHRDHNIKNGDLDNLAWLCHYCNVMEANIWALQKRGRAEVTYDKMNGRKRLVVTFKE